jgi:hypothetical protein
MVDKNFQYFAGLLTGEAVCLQLDATLVDTDLCLNPSAIDAYQILVSNVSSLLLDLQRFPRWMSGYCLPCPDPDTVDTTSAVRATKLFTFLDEIAKMQQVRDGVQLINEAAQNVLVKAKMALRRYVYILIEQSKCFISYNLNWIKRCVAFNLVIRCFSGKIFRLHCIKHCK